ncbi:MAG: hypothetical protein MUC31_01915, partial [Bacteroidales bacterium]|nr:hypothetical protein [Bacteroidales bacterium]
NGQQRSIIAWIRTDLSPKYESPICRLNNEFKYGHLISIDLPSAVQYDKYPIYRWKSINKFPLFILFLSVT